VGVVVFALSAPLLLLPWPASPQDVTACNPKAAEGVVGKPYSDGLAEEARRASGAEAVRPFGPGIPSSMDWRSRRLNLLLDRKGVVVGTSCG
jgi:hypothetical protein